MEGAGLQSRAEPEELTSPAGKPGGLCLSEPAFNLAPVSFPFTIAWNIAPRGKGWFDRSLRRPCQGYWALLLWPEEVAEKAVVCLYHSQNLIGKEG